MHLNKIHHIAIICSDYVSSKAFYTEKRFFFTADPDNLPIEFCEKGV